MFIEEFLPNLIKRDNFYLIPMKKIMNKGRNGTNHVLISKEQNLIIDIIKKLLFAINSCNILCVTKK